MPMSVQDQVAIADSDISLVQDTITVDEDSGCHHLPNDLFAIAPKGNRIV